MKKPKLLKLPKAPKASASPAVWERYTKRLKTVQDRNAQRLKPWQNEKKKKEQLQAQARKLREKGAV